MGSHSSHDEVLRVLHHVLPAITLAYFVIAQIFSLYSVQSLQNCHRQIKRKPLLLMQFGVLTLYAIEALLLVINDLISYPNYSSTDNSVSQLRPNV